MHACIPCPSICHKGAHDFLGLLFCSRHIINMCLLLKIRLGIIQLGKLIFIFGFPLANDILEFVLP